MIPAGAPAFFFAAELDRILLENNPAKQNRER